MIVKTGVIAAAGSGTRMLPVTLGYPKELLPIINKPAIQLIIEEYLEAGINKIIIVTGENDAPLRRQYELKDLPARNKYPSLDKFVDSMSEVEIIFEPQSGPYGNGTPLLVAERYINNDEGFIYSYGDDIIKSKISFSKQLIDTHLRTNGLVAGTQEVKREDVVKYGIVEFKPDTDREMKDVIEKPSIEEAKSNLAMFGRFLLSKDVISILKETPLGKSNELWLTDAVREYIRRGGKVIAQPVIDGEWLTIGDPVNYLITMFEYAMDNDEIREALKSRLKKMF